MFRPRRRNTRTGYRLLAWKDQSRNRIRPYLCISGCNADKQKQHAYLYWEYPDPQIGNKAIRMGNWKGIITDIRKGNTRMELYDLENDIQELHDVADKHPDIVEKFNQLMSESSTPPENLKFAF